MAKSKAQLEVALKGLGVALTGDETSVELSAILKKAKNDAKTDPVPVAPVATTVVVPKTAAKSSVHVSTTNGVRVFSKEEHGAKFNDVAAEFQKTNASKVIAVAHDVPVKEA